MVVLYLVATVEVWDGFIVLLAALPVLMLSAIFRQYSQSRKGMALIREIRESVKKVI